MVPRPVARQGGKQRRLAAAALPGDDQSFTTCVGALGKVGQHRHVRGSINTAQELAAGVGFVAHTFLRQRIGSLILGVEPVNQRVELLAHHLHQRLGVGVGFNQGQLAVADALLEGGKLRLALFGSSRCLSLSLFLDVGRDVPLGHVPAFVVRDLGILLWVLAIGRIAEVEEGVARHLRVPQDAVKELQFRDRGTVLDMFLQPRLALDDFGRNRVGNPPVPLAEQAEEVRPTAFDLGEAQRQDLTLRRLLLGDAPAQIHLGEGDKAFGALAAQLGEDPLHQQIPLPLHVPEGGGDEDAYDAVARRGRCVIHKCFVSRITGAIKTRTSCLPAGIGQVFLRSLTACSARAGFLAATKGVRRGCWGSLRKVAKMSSMSSRVVMGFPFRSRMVRPVLRPM